MSEYQYYEFQAVDRPLSKAEMAELRALTSRATITPSLLRNVYQWGSFKGNPAQLIEKYFDAFLYEANWGTRQLMLRLPRRLLDLGVAQQYCVHGRLDVRASGEFVVVDFLSSDEDGGGGWIDQIDSEAWLPSLLPLRTELGGGDLRSLYLGWLAAVASGYVDEGETEPPVPAGLGSLSAPLQTLAEFLEIDHHLVAIAAERSEAREEWQPLGREVEQWIASLAVRDKDAFLLRVLNEGGQHLQAELQRRFRQERAPRHPTTGSRHPDRTVQQLLAAAEERAKAEQRAKEEREAQERARRQREEAIARAKQLDGLVGREEELWRQIETLVEVKRAAEYDEAIQLLKDLHDLAARAGASNAFRARAADLRARHTRKPSFVARIDEAGLGL